MRSLPACVLFAVAAAALQAQVFGQRPQDRHRHGRAGRQGPDGLLYLVSSNTGAEANTGAVFRIEPAE